MAMLEIGDLCVSYGQVDAVRNVSLQVAEREIVSIIGPNGAGKTTLLLSIIGLLPSRGLLRFNNQDIRERDIESRVESGLCLVPEQRELFGELSVLDNLKLGAYTRRLDTKELYRQLEVVYEKFPRLEERRAQLAHTLSGGERQMLAIGRALMASPKVLMLDEPSLGLAPLIVRDILTIVSKLRDDGVSILLVEQNARAALEISDRGIVLETGEVVLTGKSGDLAHDSRVQAAYLGGAH